MPDPYRGTIGFLATILCCATSIAQTTKAAPAETASARHGRIMTIRRDCVHASYADEPTIAEIFSKSELVIVGSGGLRMLLSESLFATGTDWDKDKRVVEMRIEHVIKGSPPGRSLPVVIVETRPFPLDYATMLAGWRQRAMIFLVPAGQEGFWELTCKEPIHPDLYPALPTTNPKDKAFDEADSPRQKLLNLLRVNVEEGELDAAEQSAKAVRDLGELDSIEMQLKERVRRVLMKEYGNESEAAQFLCNVSCFAPEVVRTVLNNSWRDLPKDALPFLERTGECLPGPIPQIADAALETLESGKAGDHGKVLSSLAAHIVPDHAARFVKLFPKLSPWQKGMGSFALVKVLDEETLPLYLANLRAEQGEMQRYFALHTINTVDGLIEPAILKYKGAVVREIMECIARNRSDITEFPNAQLPMAVWRLAHGDQSLPPYADDAEKDADALLNWWVDAQKRYR